MKKYSQVPLMYFKPNSLCTRECSHSFAASDGVALILYINGEFNPVLTGNEQERHISIKIMQVVIILLLIIIHQ